MRQIAYMPHNSVTRCNWHTWPCALFSIKELACRTPLQHQLNQFNPDAVLHFWPGTFSEFWCGPIDLCYFSPRTGSVEWLSLVVILKGSVSKGCVCTVQWVMVHDPIVQHGPSLFQIENYILSSEFGCFAPGIETGHFPRHPAVLRRSTALLWVMGTRDFPHRHCNCKNPLLLRKVPWLCLCECMSTGRCQYFI